MFIAVHLCSIAVHLCSIAVDVCSIAVHLCSIAVDVCLIHCPPNMEMCMVVIDGILLQACSQEAAVPWTFYFERSSLFCSSSGTSGM